MNAIRRLAVLLAIALPFAALAGRDFVPLPGAPGELRGQVTRRDGTPVKTFTVNGLHFDDSAGNFKILVPPQGLFRVVIRASGFAPTYIQVEGAAGKKLSMPEITLSQGEQLLGEVVDAETGMPIPGAYASLADPAKIERLRFIRPERLADVAETGVGGYYKLVRAPRGLLLLVVSHPEYLPEYVPMNTRERPPVVTLHKPAALAGVVRDASGAPAAGVKVIALSEQMNDGGEATTDAAGRWSITGLRPGPYMVHALAGGTNAGSVTPVELRDGRTATLALDIGADRSAELRGGLFAQAAAR
jgi:hypothetical protein